MDIVRHNKIKRNISDSRAPKYHFLKIGKVKGEIYIRVLSSRRVNLSSCVLRSTASDGLTIHCIHKGNDVS